MLVDVLAITQAILVIMQLLSEASRVKPPVCHCKGSPLRAAGSIQTLQFMDWVGKPPHGVVLPYNIKVRRQWNEFFSATGFWRCHWQEHLASTRFPFSGIFGRGLQLLALLEEDGNSLFLAGGPHALEPLTRSIPKV